MRCARPCSAATRLSYRHEDGEGGPRRRIRRLRRAARQRARAPRAEGGVRQCRLALRACNTLRAPSASRGGVRTRLWCWSEQHQPPALRQRWRQRDGRVALRARRGTGRWPFLAPPARAAVSGSVAGAHALRALTRLQFSFTPAERQPRNPSHSSTAAGSATGASCAAAANASLVCRRTHPAAGVGRGGGVRTPRQQRRWLLLHGSAAARSSSSRNMGDRAGSARFRL